LYQRRKFGYRDVYKIAKMPNNRIEADCGKGVIAILGKVLGRRRSYAALSLSNFNYQTFTVCPIALKVKGLLFEISHDYLVENLKTQKVSR
jgi:hypothetical protein